MVPANYKKCDDRELVALCLGGDSQAWEALVRRYKRLIWSIALKFHLSTADSADVFQTICVIWIENLHCLRNEERLLEWLITTARRECLHVQNARLRELADLGEQLQAPDLATFTDPNQDVEEWQALVEQEQALRDSIEELGEPCRSLIELMYFDDPPASYEEISKKLALPIGSVGPTRARCLDKLRNRLRRRGVTANF